MKSKQILFIHIMSLLSITTLTNCGLKTVNHNTSDTKEESTTPATPVSSNIKNDVKNTEIISSPHVGPLTNLELQKYAYELGLDPKKDLTSEQKEQIEKRKKVRQLERSLDSQKERLQYSKVLPWLKDDIEKLEYLEIPTVEGRQVWVNKNKIWSRAKNLKEYNETMEAQDIAVGMPSEYVKKSWGEPDNIEVSGNPIYKNERWKYLKQVSTPQGYRQEKRYVYFEGGRVVGWETE